MVGRWSAETPVPRGLLRHLNSRKLVLLDLLGVLFESLPFLVFFGHTIHRVGPYFLDQGSNPRPPHSQTDSFPLHHDGSPEAGLLKSVTISLRSDESILELDTGSLYNTVEVLNATELYSL